MSMQDLSAQVAALARRVDALEASPPSPPRDVRPGTVDSALLDRLQQRSGPPFDDGPVRGSVLYAGAAERAGSDDTAGSYVWQMERPVPGLLATDDEAIAAVLAAVASPTRLRLVKAILAGAHETQQLQQALGGVSTGQLYHHLRELTAAGLVHQRSRGHYQVPPPHVVPLLVIIAAVYDLTTDTGSEILS